MRDHFIIDMQINATNAKLLVSQQTLVATEYVQG